MRRRLMIAFVGLVAGALVIAGAGSLVLTRDSARHRETQQLVAEAKSLTVTASRSQSPTVLRVIRRVLNLEDASVVRINPQGTITSSLPRGITAAELDTPELRGGDSVSGGEGNLIYAVAPVALTPNVQRRLHVQGRLAILLTRQVGDLGPTWSYFLLAGGASLLVAGLVAWQMSRRMSRPLVEVTAMTGRIASGHLASRVPFREHDYSEFSSLKKSINMMAQSLTEGREREQLMLLSVSHDLRTPLTSIRGFAEAINDGAVDDTARAAQVIIAESLRLERLVGDLLDLAKLEAQQLSMHIGPTDGAVVVALAAEAFRPIAERTGLTLIVEVPEPGTIELLIDPDRLTQLIANLLENAFTFARSNVVVALRGSDRLPSPIGPRIVVQDDGPGIATEDLPFVFDRFYQADRGPGRQFGSGLGLAIVAEIAGAMGAVVSAESPVGDHGGSRFVVDFAANPPLL